MRARSSSARATVHTCRWSSTWTASWRCLRVQLALGMGERGPYQGPALRASHHVVICTFGYVRYCWILILLLYNMQFRILKMIATTCNPRSQITLNNPFVKLIKCICLFSGKLGFNFLLKSSDGEWISIRHTKSRNMHTTNINVTYAIWLLFWRHCNNQWLVFCCWWISVQACPPQWSTRTANATTC